MKRQTLTIGTVLAVASFLLGAWRLYEEHRADDRALTVEMERRDERIRVLESVVISEHPEYTLMVYPPK